MARLEEQYEEKTTQRGLFEAPVQEDRGKGKQGVSERTTDFMGGAEEDYKDLKDIVNPISKTASPRKQAGELRKLSRENEPIIDKLIKKIDKELGTKSKWSYKYILTIIKKARRPSILQDKPWHGVKHIRDAFRFKTVINRFEDFRDAYKILREPCHW